jgi:PAT family beta-lactamase induction signal transducer AmpG
MGRVRDAVKSPHAWVSTSYFAEGYPYAIMHEVPKLLFTALGASLRVIGMTSLFHLAWNLKFLWAPFVDEYETKRRWLVGVEVLLSASLVALAFVSTSVSFVWGLATVFVATAVLSATHDLGIDGFYLEALDEADQSKFVGYRAMAYKLAMTVVKGPGVVLIGVIGWFGGLMAMALLMILITGVHAFILPRIEERRRPIGELLGGLLRFRVLLFAAGIAALVVAERELSVLKPAWAKLRAGVAATPVLSKVSTSGWIGFGLLFALLLVLVFLKPIQRRLRRSDSHYSKAFVQFLAQPNVGRILAFIVLFRTGESFLQSIKVPFLRRAMEMSTVEYGVASGTFGLVASMVATLLGGWLIARHGLRRWIWPFVLAQNVLNLLYVALAVMGENGAPSFAALTVVITLEHIGEGLGTAVFMVYIMRCCDPAHKAAHMGVLTALMSISFTIAGVTSGFIAEAVGYANYFALSFLATVPGMLLIFVVPYLDGRGEPASAGGAPAA